MADKTTTLKTKTGDNVYPNIIGDNRKNAFVDSSTITHHFYDKTHKVGFQIANETNIKIQNSLQKPAGLTKTKLVGVGTNGQENIEIGDNLTLANGKLSATRGSSGGESGISVIELTDKNGTIASTQLSKINANPQNFSFKYNGKILLFTKADSTTYQYCNNTTSSSDNNVMTTSTLLKITPSTGAYTITENVHNVVANSIHPANGGDLTNIQVGSKVYSIPSGGGGGSNKITVIGTNSDWTGNGNDPAAHWSYNADRSLLPSTAYEVGDNFTVEFTKVFDNKTLQENQIIVPYSPKISLTYNNYKLKYGDVVLVLTNSNINLQCSSRNNKNYSVSATVKLTYSVVKAGTTGADVSLPLSGWNCSYSYIIYTLGISAE